MTGATQSTQLRKVLIVSPHFPPINAPDMQRVRLALPYLRSLGWEPVVLTLEPDMIEGGVIEPLLEKTYPKDVRIIRVRGIPPSATRWAGVGSLWLRCGAAIRGAGTRLLRAEKFDLVFFSTTQFDAFTLGPLWAAKFGLPYVLDYQDPWVNDYYRSTNTVPPGGRFKFAYSQWRARQKEPKALRGASGVIAVSDGYGAAHARNYPWFDASKVRLLTFGAAENDFAIAGKHRPSEPLVPFGDGNYHHVYAGRCGPDMSTSLATIFRGFKRFLAERPAEAERVRFHFIGTDYAPRPLGREWAMPVARREGVEAFVSEHCYRVPYFDALYCLTHADALLVAGSNDPTYSASKIYPYVLAKRPLLLVFHSRSPVIAIARQLGCTMTFEYEGTEDIGPLSESVAREWFLNGGMGRFTAVDPVAFEPYTAKGMTRQLVECFDAAVRSGPPKP
jgi:Glycosyl transferase 4-like domain